MSDAARRLVRQGRLAAAARAWSEASPRLVGLSHAARLLARTGQLERAEASLAQARALDPHHADVHLATAALALHRGRADHARAPALAAVDASSGDARADALCLLAAIDDALGDPDAALGSLAVADPLADADRRLELRVVRGRLTASEPGALRSLQALVTDARAAGHVPVEADALTTLGRALVDRRDYVRGRAAHEAAVALHGRTGDRLGAAASVGGLGLGRLGAGAVAEAATFLQRAIQLCADAGADAAEAAWRAPFDEVLVLLRRTEWRVRELERFVEVVERLDDPARLRSLYVALAESHEELRDPTVARAWHDRAHAIPDATDARIR